MRHLISLMLLVLTSSIAFAQDDPSARLYDTRTPSATPLAEGAFNIGAWTLVPEETTTHAFAGDAVVMNDKIAVVLRKQSVGVEVHYKSAGGFKIGAGFATVPIWGTDPLAGFRIVENGSGAVTMETKYQSGATLALRMTTGEGTLEIQPGEKAAEIGIDSPTSYLVVPDFFGDDLVFAPKLFDGRALPAENMCINLIHGGDAMMMCVWQSSKQQAWLVAAADGMTTMRINCMKGKKIWLAFMQGEGMWREEKTTGAFKAPFTAKWRSNRLLDHGVAESSDAQTTAVAVAGARIIYPLDREADTPLTAVLPTDVMRNTLGVGPCQYILAVEGMNAEGDPTPNSVMNWVEKQFEQKKEVKAADDIKERLEYMTKHIAEANGRIKGYADFAAESRKTLEADAKSAAWLDIVKDLERYAKAGLEASPETANELAARVIALEGKEGGAAECRKIGAQLREIGEIQDRALARCRMAIRRLSHEGHKAMASYIFLSPGVAAVQVKAMRLLESNQVE